MSHQDWEPVVFKKKNTEVQKEAQRRQSAQAASATVSKTANKPAWKIEKQVDGDGPPVTYVSKDDANKIVQGRVAMKLSQKDLAQRLNMQFKDIQDIENGKAVENKAVLSKIKRFLHI
jgi:ribosome-binding protein aMBF1 (putative translation factor)